MSEERDRGSGGANWVVIFRATIAALDADYAAMAATMRERALGRYGCKAFVASCEDGQEIALSYWENKDDIRAWRADAEHLVAQRLGRERWYRDYSVEVARIERRYGPLR
jgi:heme-degrading monooxygenase HmoA